MSSYRSTPRGLPSNPRPAYLGQTSPAPQVARAQRSMPSMAVSGPPPLVTSERGHAPNLRQKKSFHSTRRHHVSGSTSTSSLRSASSGPGSSSSSGGSSPRASLTSLSDSADSETAEGGTKPFWHGHSYRLVLGVVSPFGTVAEARS